MAGETALSGTVGATIAAIDRALDPAPVDPAALPVVVFDRFNGAAIEAVDKAIGELFVLRGLLATIPWNRPVVEQQTAAVNVALAEITLARSSYLVASDAMAAEPQGMH